MRCSAVQMPSRLVRNGTCYQSRRPSIRSSLFSVGRWVLRSSYSCFHHRIDSMDKIEALNGGFGGDVVVKKDRVTVKQESALASSAMDRLVRAVVFGDKIEKEHARWLIWQL